MFQNKEFQCKVLILKRDMVKIQKELLLIVAQRKNPGHSAVEI